jgi:hypothetical protein
MEELDEFGIPIKKIGVDEFGIPLKKKDVSQQVGPKTAKVSTTSVGKKSLLDTVGQKRDAASVSSNGKSKIPEGKLSKLKGEFDESVRNKPKTIKQKIQGEEMGLLTKPKSSIGVTKVQDQNRFVATKKKEEEHDFNFFGVDSLKKMDETGKIKYANDEVEYDVDKNKFYFFLNENLGNAKMKKRNDYINNFELQEIEDEYNELKNGGGFWDKTKKVIESGIVNMFDEAYSDKSSYEEAIAKSKDLFYDERQEVVSEAKAKGESLTQAQINARIEKTFKDRRINEILSKKRQDTGRNLTDAEQYALSKDVISNSSKLSEKHKEKSENVNSVYVTTKGLLDEKKSIEDIYNSDPTLITKEQEDRYKDISEKIQLNNAYIKATMLELNDAEKKIKTAQEEVADYTIENSRLNEFFKRVTASGVSFLGSTAEFAGKYGGTGLSIMPGGKNLGEGVKMLSEKVSDKLSGYASDIRTGKDYDGFKIGGLPETKEVNSVGDFVNQITEVVGDNTFLVAGLTATGPTGIGLMAVEMAGDKSREIRNEKQEFNKLSEEAKVKGEKSFDYNGEKYKVGDELYGDFSSYALPLAWGATSVLPMAKQLKYLKGAKSAIQAVERESPELIKKSLMTKVKDGTKDYIGHSLSLAKDLKIMSLSQAALDDIVGKDVDYFKVASDMATIRDSFVLHGMNKAAAMSVSKAAKPYMTTEEVNTIDGNANLIFDLTNRLRDPSIESSDKAIIKSQLDRLVKESDGFIGGVLDRMSEMSDVDYSKVISLAKESSNLRKEASDIQASSFTKTEKAYALEKVKKEYIENEKKLRDLRVNYTKRTDGFYGLSDQEKIKLKERAATELKEKRGDEENFTINDREITIKATEIYDRENNVEENKTTEEDDIVNNNINTGLGIAKSYSSLDSVPEFMRPLANKSSFGEQKIGMFGKKEKIQMYNVTATAEELQVAYDNFYGKKEINKKDNPYYYNTDPERGELELRPLSIPEGYTSIKEIQNGFELDAWKKQKTKPTETTINEKENEVERLRDEEQKEYESVDLNDKVKLGEIYSRYDKLISPLLKEIEASKAKEETSVELPEKTTEEKIAELETELETIKDDNDPRITEIDKEISDLEEVKNIEANKPETVVAKEEPLTTPEGIDIATEKSNEIESTEAIESTSTEENINDSKEDVKERKPKQTVEGLKEENIDLKNQLTDLFKGAVDALKITERSFKDKIRDVNNAVSKATELFNAELKNKKLTPAQHRNILNKLSKLSKSSNSKTLESNLNDVVNSIEKASYKANKVELLSGINRSIKKAISNLSNTRLGGNSGNIEIFKKLLSIDPKNISDRYVQEYKDVVDLLADPLKIKQSGISLLDIERRAREVLYEYGFDKTNLENASSKYSDYIHENDLEMTSEGFEEVIGKMKTKDLLSEEEYQSLLDNKSKIIPRKSTERTSKEPYTSEERTEIKKSVKSSIKEYKDGAVKDVDFINNEEKEVVDSVFNAMDRIGDEFMDSLSDKDLARVENTIALLNQGIVQGDLNFFVNNKIKSYEKSQKVKPKIKEIDTKWRSLIIIPKIKKTLFDVVDFLKTDYRKDKNLSKIEQADRVLQTAVDKAFGITGDVLYNNLLAEQASNAGKDQNYRLAMKNKYVNPIIKFLDKTYRGDKIKQVESMMRIDMFAYQRMFENGSPGENHRKISDIVKSIKSKSNNLYSKKEVDFITKELEKFAELDFDSDRYYETLTDAEKTIIRKMDEFYESDITNKAVATSKFGSGKTLNLAKFYRPVSMVFDGETQVSLEEVIKNSNDEFFKPSFKAGNLEKKEGGLETEGMIINIKDPLFAMEKYIDDISLRYHNLDSVRVVNDALKTIRESSDIKGDSKSERIVKYFQDIVNKDVENLVAGSVGAQIFSGNSEVAIASNKILSNASVNKLIGISKVVSESYSNIVRTSASLSTYVKGIGVYTELIKGNLDIDKIFYNIGFSQTGRTFGDIFDFKIKKDSANVDVPKDSGNKAPNRIPSEIVNEIYKMLNKTGIEDAKLLSEEIAKAMIETPDKTIAKPLSLGIFDRVFEKLTGEEPEYRKIENGDVDYLDKHKENIKEAVFSANKTVAMMIGSKNPFEMVSNNMVNIKDPTYKKLYTQFNSFFTNHSKSQATANYVEIQKLFRTNEYETAADKLQAYKTIASVIASQYAYKSAMRALQGYVGTAAARALGYTIFEDEEDKEGIFARELTGSVLDVMNASSGNISKIPSNMAIGYLDTKYGRDIGLRQGLRGYGTSVGFGYDPKKSIDDNVKNSLLSASGSYGVANKDINSLVDSFMDGDVANILLKGASLASPIPLLKDVNSAKSYIKYNTIPSIEDQREIYKSGSSKDIKELENSISNYVNTIVYNKYLKAYKERGRFNSSEMSSIRKELVDNIHVLTKGDYDKLLNDAGEKALIRIKVRTGKVSKDAESYLQMKDSEIKSDLVIRYRDANDEEKKKLVKVMNELADLNKISQSIVNEIKRIEIKSK